MPTGFRKMARHLVVAYVEDRVVDIDVSGRRARSVGLASGERLEADVVVNCANCHAPLLRRLPRCEAP